MKITSRRLKRFNLMPRTSIPADRWHDDISTRVKAVSDWLYCMTDAELYALPVSSLSAHAALCGLSRQSALALYEKEAMCRIK